MSKFNFLICGVIFLAVLRGGTWSQAQPQSTFVAQSQTFTAQSEQRQNQDSQTLAIKSDLQRMRVLLNQMQMNLAFVQNTTTPLKHQFELEIEMWQILIRQMEERLQSTGAKPAQ